MSRRLALVLVVAVPALAAGVYLLLAGDDPAAAATAGLDPDRDPGPDRNRDPDPDRDPTGAAHLTGALAPASLSGRVTDADGRPVPQAEVSLTASGRIVGSVRTDQTGSFTQGVGPGDYVLVARQRDLASEPLGPVPVAPGEALRELTLVLAPGASVSGTVFDAAGSPLPGASVVVSGFVSTSDEGGGFELTGLPRGPTLLWASKDGYDRREQRLDLQGPVTGLEIVLSRSARVSGTVEDADGNPVPGASVWAVPYRLAGTPPAGGGGVADAAGAFELDAPAGHLQVEAASPSGQVGRSAPFDLAPGTYREGITVRLGSPASLSGRVVDAAGTPAAGAEVRVVGGDAAALASATAGSDGRFFVAVLPPGRVRAVAALGAARGTSEPVQVGEGESAEVEVVLGAGALTGLVVDASGALVAGASVAAWPEGTPRALAATAVTDGRGGFSLGGLPQALLRVEASSGAARGELRGVRAGDRPRIVIASGVLSGVVRRGGRPATDFTIGVAPLEPGRAGARAERVMSADGRFRLPLPPGRYEVRASAPGAVVATATAEVPSRGTSREVRLDLEEGGVIAGRVLEVGSGLPVEGARVSTSRIGTFAFGQATGYPGAVQAVTDTDGSFRLSGVPPGRTPVFALHPDYHWTRPAWVDVAVGASRELTIRLHRGGGPGDASFGGVGLTIAGDRQGNVVAVEVVEGGPAFEAGVRAGDRVLAVDGTTVSGANLNAVVERIRGPAGTPVVLELERPGSGRFRAIIARAELRF